MTINDKQNDEDNPDKKFICKKCDFKSNNKKDFNRHLETVKHKKKENMEIKHQ